MKTRRPMIQRIKWANVAACAIAVLFVGVMSASLYEEHTAEPVTVTYNHVVEPGETLWDIVARIGKNKHDVSKLTWQVMQDNHIQDPGNLQPGTPLVISVEEVRK